MKLTYSWLKKHLATDLSLDQLEEAMTMAGLEIENIDNPAGRLAAFTVAHVKDARPHPNADRLRVCMVETRDGVKQIVCGAPNARAGMTAIYAPLGAYIPGLDLALDRKPRNIRGVKSHGMLCSPRELESGEDHDGIADLSGDWAVGTPAAEALGLDDPIIDFEVTPNRPDWLGVHGIARDLAAAGAGMLKTGRVPAVSGGFPCPVTVKLDWANACPIFAGRVIKGVKNGPSPGWLQQYLKAIGIHPKNLLVDVTNYIAFDRARPLHVYDLDKIGEVIYVRKGGGKPDAHEGLDAKIYTPEPEHCVIADDERPLGLGGIMGGAYSGCSDETTDIFLESAWFDPGIIRKSARELGIDSDAKHRFERGVDPEGLTDGIELATAIILEYAGGKASDLTVSGQAPARPPDIAFDPSRVKRILGFDPGESRIKTILTSLGFGVIEGDIWTVSAPSWRRDCLQAADLIEEIARIAGFDSLPAAPFRRPEGGRFRAPATELQNRIRTARRAAAHRGYQEAITWSFCHHDQAGLFGGTGEGLELANPISSELNVMRPSVLIHLITNIQKSTDRGLEDERYFEAGPIYLNDTPGGQETVVAAARRVVAARDWRYARTPDVFDIKADAQSLLEAVGVPVKNQQVTTEVRDWWRPGRAGVLRLGPRVLAEFGEIHPRVLKALDIDSCILAFEVFLNAIPMTRKKSLKARTALQLPDLMPVRRDFAFLVENTAAACDLIKAVKSVDKHLITDVKLFDVYEGQGVPENQISLALEATLQPTRTPLTDKDIEAVSAKIINAAEKVGAVLRG